MQSGEHESEGIVSIMKYSILHSLAFPPGWQSPFPFGYNWLNDSGKKILFDVLYSITHFKNETKGKYGITLCYSCKVHGFFY